MGHDAVHIGVLVLVAISIHLVVLAQERALVKGVLLWHATGLGYLVELRVKDEAAARRVSLLLASEDEDFPI